MHRARTTERLLLFGSVVSLALPGAALAGVGNGGGAGFPQRPTVSKLSCAGGNADVCRQGESLTLTGDALDGVSSVTFRGRRAGDDQSAAPQSAGEHRLTVIVPLNAHTGRLRLVTQGPPVAGPKVIVRAARRSSASASMESAAPDAGVFPIKGRHDLGQSATNNFGGPRGHKGQDLFAKCGTPLVAALGGTVTAAKFEARAGNYAVITDPSGQSEVYMHMREPASVHSGEPVTTGQPIGRVGDTGDAEGCHLHFELWTAPGWYAGGHPIDPLPTLERWDAG